MDMRTKQKKDGVEIVDLVLKRKEGLLNPLTIRVAMANNCLRGCTGKCEFSMI
jgi:hypothetical protein